MKNIKWFVLSFTIILLGIGTFFDLQISNLLSLSTFDSPVSTNFFGRFFETFGEMPVYFIVAFCFLILLFNIKENQFLKFLFFLLGSFSLFLSFHKVFYYLFSYINFNLVNDNIFFILFKSVLSICVCFLFYKLFKKIDTKTMKNLLSVAIFSLILIFVSNSVTHLLKGVFGRVRFVTMLSQNDTDFSMYSPWWKITSFFASSNKSFPSGHVTACSSLLCFVFLIKIVPKYRDYYKLITSFCFAFIFLVAFSRIIMGKHFLTDVTFAFLITFIFFLILEKIFFKKLYKN